MFFGIPTRPPMVRCDRCNHVCRSSIRDGIAWLRNSTYRKVCAQRDCGGTMIVDKDVDKWIQFGKSEGAASLAARNGIDVAAAPPVAPSTPRPDIDPAEPAPELLATLTAMGFPPDQARLALRSTGMDVKRAADWLLTRPTPPPAPVSATTAPTGEAADAEPTPSPSVAASDPCALATKSAAPAGNAAGLDAPPSLASVGSSPSTARPADALLAGRRASGAARG
jgi:hypothetical protein